MEEPTPIRMAELSFDFLTGVEGRRQMGELLNRTFPVPAGQSFFDDFPVWDPSLDAPVTQVARIGAFTPKGRLLSIAAARIAALHAAGDETLPIAIIGAVATSEEARGQGLASRTVARALQWSIDQGAALALLWGSEHKLYRRLGFELCGEQCLVPLAFLKLPALGPSSASSASSASSTSSASSAEIGRGFMPGLFDRLRERGAGLRLRMDDQRWLAAQKNVQWYWLGNPTRPRAYAAIGRGIDLPNIVHEWGGERADLELLLSRLLVDHPEASLLGNRALLERYRFAQAIPHANMDYLALARVLDPERVFRAFHPDSRMTARLTKSGAWACSFDGEKPLLLETGELPDIFFGPNSLKAGGIAAAQWLPLPLWVWGLDAG